MLTPSYDSYQEMYDKVLDLNNCAPIGQCTGCKCNCQCSCSGGRISKFDWDEMILAPSEESYKKMFGSITDDDALCMARCACVACNSCTCACSCRVSSNISSEWDLI